MEKHKRMQFLKGARDSAPSDFKSTWNHEHNKNIPNEHSYALAEILTEGKDGTYVRILASGDGPGIRYAWTHGQENHPRPDSLRLIDLNALETAIENGTGKKIDFH